MHRWGGGGVAAGKGSAISNKLASKIRGSGVQKDGGRVPEGKLG